MYTPVALDTPLDLAIYVGAWCLLMLTAWATHAKMGTQPKTVSP